MCLILFAYNKHPQYKLVVAANRDEFYDRPAAPMAFWTEAPKLLAGRDLKAGGTWLGVTRSGRFAAITNFRDPAAVKTDAPSRGHLVSDYLLGNDSAKVYIDKLSPIADRYNGFNLLAGDEAGLWYFSNRGGAPRPLAPGLYGLSNHLLDTPWPKVEVGRRRLRTILESLSDDININRENEYTRLSEQLFDMLQDRAVPADEELPDTGIGRDWERQLAPIFIESPRYGTRSSTVLVLDTDNHGFAAEKNYLPNHDGAPARNFIL